jgi:hypothetical protein
MLMMTFGLGRGTLHPIELGKFMSANCRRQNFRFDHCAHRCARDGQMTANFGQLHPKLESRKLLKFIYFSAAYGLEMWT